MFGFSCMELKYNINNKQINAIPNHDNVNNKREPFWFYTCEKIRLSWPLRIVKVFVHSLT